MFALKEYAYYCAGKALRLQIHLFCGGSVKEFLKVVLVFSIVSMDETLSSRINMAGVRLLNAVIFLGA